MALKGLLKDLANGNTEDQRVGFLTPKILRGKAQRLAVIDTCTLVFVCALRQKEVYNKEGHTSAATTPKITTGG